jgi:hypothetical protein
MTTDQPCTGDACHCGARHCPAFDWVDISTWASPDTYIRGQCLHRDTVPVTAADGDTVAHLCRNCDTSFHEGKPL